MNCEYWTERIDEAIDGVLPPDEEAALRDHCRQCDSCGRLLKDLLEIRDLAGSLERRPAPPELWNRIAARLDRPRRAVWAPLAAAAAVLLAVGTAAWFGAARFVERPPDTTAELARSAESELQQAEVHYVNAIAALEKLTDDRKGSLDPMVADEIARSLLTIDRAIGDTRAALKKEPGSLVAQASLLEALRMKVSLLQEAVSLIGDAEREATTTLPKS